MTFIRQRNGAASTEYKTTLKYLAIKRKNADKINPKVLDLMMNIIISWKD